MFMKIKDGYTTIRCDYQGPYPGLLQCFDHWQLRNSTVLTNMEILVAHFFQRTNKHDIHDTYVYTDRHTVFYRDSYPRHKTDTRPA